MYKSHRTKKVQSIQCKSKNLFPNYNHRLGQNTLIHLIHYVPKVTPTLFSNCLSPDEPPAHRPHHQRQWLYPVGEVGAPMDHQYMALLMFSIVVMSLRRGGAKQARACMDKKEAKKRGQFYADRRSPQSDRWESWWSQWYDNHDDHHIDPDEEHFANIWGPADATNDNLWLWDWQ